MEFLLKVFECIVTVIVEEFFGRILKIWGKWRKTGNKSDHGSSEVSTTREISAKQMAWISIVCLIIVAVIGGVAFSKRTAGGEPGSSLKETETISPRPRNTPYKEEIIKGNIVQFGHYPQTKKGNDETPIDWIVLEVDEKEALLVSKYGLDAKPFHDKQENVTWEDCALRKWLNEDFLNKAFSEAEQSAIQKKSVDNSGKQCYREWSFTRDNTEDYLFLLSYAEARKYFGVLNEKINRDELKLAPTSYAIKHGAYHNKKQKTEENLEAGWWWLRSPGDSTFYAAGVHWQGHLINIVVYNNTGSVRPAMWLDLTSEYFNE